MSVRILRPYIAECFATFVLTFAVSISLSRSLPVATPVIAATVLGLFVYMIGSVSGAHLNPAVTIALWSANKLKRNDALFYILAQVLGALISMVIVSMASAFPQLTPMNGVDIFLGELIGTFMLVIAVSSVIYGKTPHDASGAVIGGGLLIGILIAGELGTNGVLNPAVALGIGSLSVSYILGPICGALLAAWFYRWLVAAK